MAYLPGLAQSMRAVDRRCDVIMRKNAIRVPQLRPAALSDLAGLVRLEGERFPTDRLTRKSLQGLIRSPSAFVLIASRGERLLGYAVLLTRRGSRTARLYSIAVSADAAGQGVGSRLLSAIESVASERGADHLQLEVRADNPAAIHLYERAGYLPTGRRSRYYEDGMTALVFTRDLRSKSNPVVA